MDFPKGCFNFRWFPLTSIDYRWFPMDFLGFTLLSFDFLFHIWFPEFFVLSFELLLSCIRLSLSGWASAGIATLYPPGTPVDWPRPWSFLSWSCFALPFLCCWLRSFFASPCSAERHRDEGGGDLEAYASGALRHIVQRGEPTRGRITRSTHLNLPEIPTHPPHGPSAFSSLLSAFVYHFSMVHLYLSLLNLPSRRQNHFGLIFIRCSFDVRSISI